MMASSLNMGLMKENDKKKGRKILRSSRKLKKLSQNP
jgi:hypothetical protein